MQDDEKEEVKEIYGFVKEGFLMLVEYIDILEKHREYTPQATDYLIDLIKLRAHEMECYLHSNYVQRKLNG